jgi:polyisoprenoid-binding protein YceI
MIEKLLLLIFEMLYILKPKPMKSTIAILILLLTSITTQAQKINQELSKVEFSISNMGIMSVDGFMKGMSGNIKFEENNLSASYFDVTVNPSTVNTDNSKRDEHLKNEDFFNVSKYSVISFKSKEIIKKDNQYIAKGELTMLGVTKSIEIPFTVSTNGTIKTLVGEIEVNREVYNLGTEEYSGGFMVGKVATVKITCVIE